MRQKVFLNEISLFPMYNGREIQKTTIDMFHWANPKKNKTQRFSEWRANRDCELIRMAREQEMLRTKKGTQIEDATPKKGARTEIASLEQRVGS